MTSPQQPGRAWQRPQPGPVRRMQCRMRRRDLIVGRLVPASGQQFAEQLVLDHADGAGGIPSICTSWPAWAKASHQATVLR